MHNIVKKAIYCPQGQIKHEINQKYCVIRILYSFTGIISGYGKGRGGKWSREMTDMTSIWNIKQMPLHN